MCVKASASWVTRVVQEIKHSDKVNKALTLIGHLWPDMCMYIQLGFMRAWECGGNLPDIKVLTLTCARIVGLSSFQVCRHVNKVTTQHIHVDVVLCQGHISADTILTI